MVVWGSMMGHDEKASSSTSTCDRARVMATCNTLRLLWWGAGSPCPDERGSMLRAVEDNAVELLPFALVHIHDVDALQLIGT